MTERSVNGEDYMDFSDGAKAQKQTRKERRKGRRTQIRANVLIDVEHVDVWRGLANKSRIVNDALKKYRLNYCTGRER